MHCQRQPPLPHCRPRAAPLPPPPHPPTPFQICREATEVAHITPQELAESLAARTAGANEDVQYLDVREEAEEDMARLPHFQLLPLSRRVIHVYT